MAETYYSPGVCNINPQETRSRKQAFYIGSAAVVSLLGIFYILDVSAIIGLIIFVPAWIAALGYIQAKHKFCVGYAALGKYSSGNKFGQTANVDKKRNLLADTFKARQLNRRAQLYGAVTAILAVALLTIT
jgi:hypothetical protein